MDLAIYDDQNLVDEEHRQLAEKLFNYGAQKISLPENTEASITFCTPAKIQEINRQYRQTQEYGHSFEREFGYSVVHGLLHLSGYDHIQKAEAAVMFGLQKQILNDFGLKR